MEPLVFFSLNIDTEQYSSSLVRVLGARLKAEDFQVFFKFAHEECFFQIRLHQAFYKSSSTDNQLQYSGGTSLKMLSIFTRPSGSLDAKQPKKTVIYSQISEWPCGLFSLYSSPSFKWLLK